MCHNVHISKLKLDIFTHGGFQMSFFSRLLRHLAYSIFRRNPPQDNVACLSYTYTRWSLDIVGYMSVSVYCCIATVDKTNARTSCTISHSKVRISCWLIRESWVRFVLCVGKKYPQLLCSDLQETEVASNICPLYLLAEPMQMTGHCTVIFRKRRMSRGGWRNSCS